MVTQSGGGAGSSGAGSSGAGIDKCTEVANGKHNTKIDKFLQQEEQFAEKCKKTQDECNQQKKQPKPEGRSGTAPSSPPGGPQQPAVPGATDGPSRDTARGPTANHVDSEVAEDENEEDDDEEENEEGEEEENDNVDGDGAADTKKKGHTH